MYKTIFKTIQNKTKTHCNFWKGARGIRTLFSCANEMIHFVN